MSLILEMVDVTRIHGEGHLAVQALTNASLTVASGGNPRFPVGVPVFLRAISGHRDTGFTDCPGNALYARLNAIRRRIGYVFQQLNLIEGLTAAENVSLPLELDGMGLKEARAHAHRALEAVGLQDLGDRFPDDLSGGEQQRVAIARGIVGNRVLLLADEPTGALDSITGEAVLKLMRAHCDAGGGGVLVTHDARFAAWADRVIFLRDGKIVDETDAPDGPESLLNVR